MNPVEPLQRLEETLMGTAGDIAKIREGQDHYGAEVLRLSKIIQGLQEDHGRMLLDAAQDRRRVSALEAALERLGAAQEGARDKVAHRALLLANHVERHRRGVGAAEVMARFNLTRHELAHRVMRRAARDHPGVVRLQKYGREWRLRPASDSPGIPSPTMGRRPEGGR